MTAGTAGALIDPCFFEKRRLDVVISGHNLSQGDDSDKVLRLDFSLEVSAALAGDLPDNLRAFYDLMARSPACIRTDLGICFYGYSVELYETERKRAELSVAWTSLYRFRLRRQAPGAPIVLSFSFDCNPAEVSSFWSVHFGDQVALRVEQVQGVLRESLEAQDQEKEKDNPKSKPN